MIVEKILTFFSGVTLQDTRSEVDTITSFNPQTDETSAINWKKTAQTWEIMSNVFAKDTQFSGKIAYVISDNRHKWYMKSIYELVDEMVRKVESIVSNNQRNHITKVTIPRLPSFQNYFWEKTILISDFYWSSKQINECLKACQENRLRCIIIPLMWDRWMITHPLQEKYPQFFWSMEIE
jgi:hypothetical protein